MMNFIRKHIWEHLPKAASRKTVLWSAALWGIGFVGFALLFYRLGKFERRTTEIFVGLGLVLGFLQLIPGVGEKLYLGILRVTSIFGYFVFRLGLIFAFYIVVTPMGVVMRMFGFDPLEEKFKDGHTPKWHKRTGNLDPRKYYRLS